MEKIFSKEHKPKSYDDLKPNAESASHTQPRGMRRNIVLRLEELSKQIESVKIPPAFNSPTSRNSDLLFSKNNHESSRDSFEKQANEAPDSSSSWRKMQQDYNYGKRMTHGKQGIKDTSRESPLETTLESNNEIFKMVFLNRKKLPENKECQVGKRAPVVPCQIIKSANIIENEKSFMKASDKFGISEFKFSPSMGIINDSTNFEGFRLQNSGDESNDKVTNFTASTTQSQRSQQSSFRDYIQGNSQKSVEIFPHNLSKLSSLQPRLKHFNLGIKLGKGRFGQVFVAKHRYTGFVCALKKINLANLNKKLVIQLIRQIKIQSYFNHSNLVKLYGYFRDGFHIYLIEELCFSGQLYSLMKKHKRFDQATIQQILQQVCRAVAYMHDLNVIHRDIKPENIVLHNRMLKICDFGWSVISTEMRKTFCGTKIYVSPEMNQCKEYDNMVDVWSLGILAFQMFLGHIPENIVAERNIPRLIEEEIKMAKSVTMSKDAQQFIHSCLKKNPQERLGLKTLLAHPFLAKIESSVMIEMY